MFAKIRYAWNRGCAWWLTKINQIRQYFSDEGPAGDCFWWTDVLLLLGGVLNVHTSNWIHERKIRIIFQSLSVYTVYVFYLRLYEALHEKKDASSLIMEITKVTSISISCLRMVAAAFLIKVLNTIRSFVLSNSISSGDVEYDEREQNNFNRLAKRAIQVIFSWITADTIFFLIPSSTKDDLFQFPVPSFLIGEKASKILNMICVTSIPASILPKTISCTTCIGVMLIGMRTKLRVLAHRFELISHQSISNEDQFYERIDKDLREFLTQHRMYLSYLKISKDLVGKAFLLVHYFSIFAIGALLYACHEIERSFMTAVFGAAVSFFLLEYYLLCYLIDSLQDEADSIEQHIFELGIHLPFRPERRSEYVQLRTALMIIWMNTRNGITMNCMGIFEINTPKFLSLINVAYSVLTFLIKME